MRHIYLDHNATTPLAPEVFEAMKPFLTDDFGNASSVHWFGQRARAAVEEARLAVTRLLNCRRDEVTFTGGGTESDNLAILGVVAAAKAKDGARHVITSTIEHHAVLDTALGLERRGVAATFVPVGASGVIDPADVERAIRPDTVLISIMHANNELGTIQPLEEIGRMARRHGIPFHTDAVQSVGKIPVDVEKLGVDLLSLSAHKLYGPKGTGALYTRTGTQLARLLFGGHQERDRRPGTENVAGIVGLGKAAEIALAHMPQEMARLAALRDRLEEGVLASVADVAVNGERARRVPSTSNLRFEGVDGSGFVISMDLEGVACSAGSACSSGSTEPSHVLTAIGFTPEEARASVRWSLGRSTTEEDIDSVLAIVPGVVEQLRSRGIRGQKLGISRLVARS